MSKEHQSDQMIINTILRGGKERESTLKYLFHHRHFRETTAEIVFKAGGDHEHQETVFEACIIQLDKQIRRSLYSEKSLLDFFQNQTRVQWCLLLQRNQPDRHKVLGKLGDDPDLKRQIRAVVMKNSGNLEDAEDCFQNGLELLDKQLTEGKYRGGAIKGFFYQTCYNLWRNELKKRRTVPMADEALHQPVELEDPLTVYESNLSRQLLDEILQRLGASCQKILNLKYFIMDQLSMDEIAVQMGLKNAQNASNTLTKCRKKLWELLVEHEHPYLWTRNT